MRAARRSAGGGEVSEPADGPASSLSGRAPFHQVPPEKRDQDGDEAVDEVEERKHENELGKVPERRTRPRPRPARRAAVGAGLIGTLSGADGKDRCPFRARSPPAAGRSAPVPKGRSGRGGLRRRRRDPAHRRRSPMRGRQPTPRKRRRRSAALRERPASAPFHGWNRSLGERTPVRDCGLRSCRGV